LPQRCWDQDLHAFFLQMMFDATAIHRLAGHSLLAPGFWLLAKS